MDGNSLLLVSLGLAGGVAAELLKWYGIRESLHEGLPGYAKSVAYWLVTAGMVGAGGLLVFVYQASADIKLSPLLALNIGASAPLILGALAKQIEIEGPSVG